jgi:hypothetical protein
MVTSRKNVSATAQSAAAPSLCRCLGNALTMNDLTPPSLLALASSSSRDIRVPCWTNNVPICQQISDGTCTVSPETFLLLLLQRISFATLACQQLYSNANCFKVRNKKLTKMPRVIVKPHTSICHLAMAIRNTKMAIRNTKMCQEISQMHNCELALFAAEPLVYLSVYGPVHDR